MGRARKRTQALPQHDGGLPDHVVRERKQAEARQMRTRGFTDAEAAQLPQPKSTLGPDGRYHSAPETEAETRRNYDLLMEMRRKKK